jgi:hypothetical protein
MNLDFVKVPFTNNPSMTRLEGGAYNKNPNQEYLLTKKKELDLKKEHLCGESELSTKLDLRKKITDY